METLGIMEVVINYIFYRETSDDGIQNQGDNGKMEMEIQANDSQLREFEVLKRCKNNWN